MIQSRIIALSLVACFALSGCNDKIEEANKTSQKPATEAQAPLQQLQLNQPANQPEQGHEGHQHEKAQASGGLTIADLYAKKSELSGKVISIHGNVVKVSEAIMGKNWIHIQDGSGTKETSDIVFTSDTQSAKVGDHITAKGKVAIDKDFGYGYFYSVIVEEATFSN
ncbi:hypothetical protein [Sulfurimonas sp.]|uniref:hypothetical protein n=1 Tax=Sulfurimonas sp. TaxID=2022749 RepID=UPI0025FAE296|nr:hypothetical protein [Sulfurimonas sp.]MDD5156652.1 hypothetical protein [Sulfurimonas sp.]